jgi:hypothetical protein
MPKRKSSASENMLEKGFVEASKDWKRRSGREKIALVGLSNQRL